MRYEYIYDKSKWNAGEWSKECDYVTWIDELTSYPCVIKRTLFGVWSGYVGVDEMHHFFQRDGKDVSFNYIITHGGIDYTGFMLKDDAQFSPPKRLWWIGFTCNTSHDICPRFDNSILPKEDDAKYRNMPYAVQEVTWLAYQIFKLDTRRRYIIKEQKALPKPDEEKHE